VEVGIDLGHSQASPLAGVGTTLHRRFAGKLGAVRMEDFRRPRADYGSSERFWGGSARGAPPPFFQLAPLRALSAWPDGMQTVPNAGGRGATERGTPAWGDGAGEVYCDSPSKAVRFANCFAAVLPPAVSTYQACKLPTFRTFQPQILGDGRRVQAAHIRARNPRLRRGAPILAHSVADFLSVSGWVKNPIILRDVCRLGSWTRNVPYGRRFLVRSPQYRGQGGQVGAPPPPLFFSLDLAETFLLCRFF